MLSPFHDLAPSRTSLCCQRDGRLAEQFGHFGVRIRFAEQDQVLVLEVVRRQLACTFDRQVSAKYFSPAASRVGQFALVKGFPHRRSRGPIRRHHHKRGRECVVNGALEIVEFAKNGAGRRPEDSIAIGRP